MGKKSLLTIVVISIIINIVSSYLITKKVENYEQYVKESTEMIQSECNRVEALVKNR